MRAKALRLPENLLDAVKFAEKKERIDEPTTLRKFLRIGAEKYVGDSYARGDISLREAADILDITTREAIELFWDMGVTGSAGADETLKAIFMLEKKIAKSK